MTDDVVGKILFVPENNTTNYIPGYYLIIGFRAAFDKNDNEIVTNKQIYPVDSEYQNIIFDQHIKCCKARIL